MPKVGQIRNGELSNTRRTSAGLASTSACSASLRLRSALRRRACSAEDRAIAAARSSSTTWSSARRDSSSASSNAPRSAPGFTTSAPARRRSASRAAESSALSNMGADAFMARPWRSSCSVARCFAAVNALLIWDTSIFRTGPPSLLGAAAALDRGQELPAPAIDARSCLWQTRPDLVPAASPSLPDSRRREGRATGTPNSGRSHSRVSRERRMVETARVAKRRDHAERGDRSRAACPAYTLLASIPARQWRAEKRPGLYGPQAQG